MSEEQTAVAKELSQSVQEKIANQRAYCQAADEPFTDEQATEAAMRAFVDHIHDPRTVERACAKYFQFTGTRWDQLNETTKGIWRKNIQAMLAAALE